MKNLSKAVRDYALFVRQKIREAGRTQKEAALAAGFKGAQNMVNKLDCGTLRVLEERAIAHFLGYEVVWEPYSGYEESRATSGDIAEIERNLRRVCWLCQDSSARRDRLRAEVEIRDEVKLVLTPAQQAELAALEEQRAEIIRLWGDIEHQVLSLMPKFKGTKLLRRYAADLNKQGADIAAHLYHYPILTE